MNRYGRQAMAHWERWLPQRVAEMPDREMFFSRLGLRVAEQIETLAAQLAGPDRPGETFGQRVGRREEARMTAESEVLRREVLLNPETETGPTATTAGWPAAAPWTPVVEDPADPVWQEDLRQMRDLDED